MDLSNGDIKFNITNASSRFVTLGTFGVNLANVITVFKLGSVERYSQLKRALVFSSTSSFINKDRNGYFH